MAFLIAPPNRILDTDNGSALASQNGVIPGSNGEGFIVSPAESTLLQGTHVFGWVT